MSCVSAGDAGAQITVRLAGMTLTKTLKRLPQTFNDDLWLNK